MTRILHLDASARPGRYGTESHGSHTRNLTHRFISRWLKFRPNDEVIYRDIGAKPPGAICGDWIQAAFSSSENAEPWMEKVLAESNELVDELIQSDILVLGIPMYNFNVPSAFKAWIDNIVRIGRTFEFDPNLEIPYIPLLADRPRRVVLLSSRGGYDMGPGGALAHMNHLEPSVQTALGFIGLTEIDCIAVEYQEEGGEHLTQSVKDAEIRVDRLVDELLSGPASTDREPSNMEPVYSEI
ncbi:NAD(P)H dehydrogenase [Hahella sp. CCB-MM4]|uniref:FMN-dependent NADH-azoreductase n=1 Tax=Hahella sp. (strain CCB-MM4) TaxID=1926491 RepID=UPI000B9AB845|nr:NAD(P)H-dependent oxidoreductase [Hahella sp. CCB-MM4]OZG74598.1 NAD(P)H dehydrogenase [Hahella sp. CCB-MM4]